MLLHDISKRRTSHDDKEQSYDHLLPPTMILAMHTISTLRIKAKISSQR